MNLVVAAALAFLAGRITPALGAALQLVLRPILRVFRVSDRLQVSALDRLLAEQGWCSALAFGHTRMPADGPHLLVLHDRGAAAGLLLAVRATQQSNYSNLTEYTLYYFGRGLGAVLAQVAGDPRAVALCYVYAPTQWRTVRIAAPQVPPAPLPWQLEFLTKLKTLYAEQGRVTALVCGPSGVGKSTLGDLLAAMLKGPGVSPEVVKNFDPTAKGLIVEDACDKPTPVAPVVIMIDEIDAVIDHAESDSRPKQEGTALADTPTSLLALLDRLGRSPHLIVIATSNRTLTDLTSGRYGRYVRHGRLDLHLQV